MFVGLRAENENAAKDMMQPTQVRWRNFRRHSRYLLIGWSGRISGFSIEGDERTGFNHNSAEGISFANSLGSGLTTAMMGCVSLLNG